MFEPDIDEAAPSAGKRRKNPAAPADSAASTKKRGSAFPKEVRDKSTQETQSQRWRRHIASRASRLSGSKPQRIILHALAPLTSIEAALQGISSLDARHHSNVHFKYKNMPTVPHCLQGISVRRHRGARPAPQSHVWQPNNLRSSLGAIVHAAVQRNNPLHAASAHISRGFFLSRTVTKVKNQSSGGRID
jgi:hypothetical protein